MWINIYYCHYFSFRFSFLLLFSAWMIALKVLVRLLRSLVLDQVVGRLTGKADPTLRSKPLFLFLDLPMIAEFCNSFRDCRSGNLFEKVPNLCNLIKYNLFDE